MVPVRIDSAVPHLALFASKDIIQVNSNNYKSGGGGAGGPIQENIKKSV